MGHENDAVRSEPMSITRCRELLGDDADGLSDTDIECVLRHADALAHVIVEMYLEHRATLE
jgi:hypothetical protein